MDGSTIDSWRNRQADIRRAIFSLYIIVNIIIIYSYILFKHRYLYKIVNAYQSSILLHIPHLMTDVRTFCSASLQEDGACVSWFLSLQKLIHTHPQ